MNLHTECPNRPHGSYVACGGKLEEVKDGRGHVLGQWCVRCREQWDARVQCRWCELPAKAGRVQCGKLHGVWTER